ncbi:MAG: ABC transporter permease [Bacteroidota bacterium]
MIKNYFKIAVRSLLKDKVYSIINIVGLTIGVTCSLLIIFYVQDELSYDQFHKERSNIYRLDGAYLQGGDTRNKSSNTTYQLAPALEVQIPLIKSTVRMQLYGALVKYGEKRFIEDNVLHVDSGFFDMFSFPLIKGNPKTALKRINTVVISEDIAKKYFEGADPMGKFIEIAELNLEVSGVMENIPTNSHIQADIIIPLKTIEHTYPNWVRTNWSGISHHSYILLDSLTNPLLIEKQIEEFINQFYREGEGPIYTLKPLLDIHLKSDTTGEMLAGGDIMYVYIFACVAVLIVLIACINFMNLATARSVDRAKEVGLRKVVGAEKRQIIFQFLSESIITTVIAFLLAGLLAELLLPFFNQLSGKSIEGSFFVQTPYILSLLGASVLVGGLSGVYPAFFLSSFKPHKVLKSTLVSVGKSNVNVRRLLVVIQFCISIIMIVGTLIINSQISFMRERKLGMNPELMIQVPLQTFEISQQYETFKNMLLEHPNIVDITASNANITNRIGGWREYNLEGMEEPILINTITVDHDFIHTLQADIKQGRDFSREYTTDLMEAYIINESAAKFLDLKEPVGTPLKGAIFTGSQWSRKNAKIIGVVKDFHFGSLHNKIQPIVFSLHNERTASLNFLSLRISSSQASSTIEFIKDKWSELAPDRPLEYSFIEDEIYDLYQAEDKFHDVFSTFSVLAIIIACLGIFGLSAFTTRKRIKEIGIRKVLGASIPGLTLLLTRDVTKLVLISNIMAWPIAWYAMEQWLKDFAYKIDLNIWIFFAGMFIALSIAFMTAGLQAVKTALTNPVKSLRNE